MSFAKSSCCARLTDPLPNRQKCNVVNKSNPSEVSLEVDFTERGSHHPAVPGEKRPSGWQKHVSGYKEPRGKWSKRCVSCFCRRPEEEVLAPCSESMIAGAKGQCRQEDGVNGSSSIAPATGVRAVPKVVSRGKKVKFTFSSFLRKKGRENQSGNDCFWETEEEIAKGSVVRKTEGRSVKTCEMESVVLKKDTKTMLASEKISGRVHTACWGGREEEPDPVLRMSCEKKEEDVTDIDVLIQNAFGKISLIAYSCIDGISSLNSI